MKPMLKGLLGTIGRFGLKWTAQVRKPLEHATGAWALLVAAVYYSTLGPLLGKNKLRKQLFPMMSNVGVRSLPIVCLIACLVGAILVLMTGDVLKRYGQTTELPGVVAISMCLELGPLMTAIVLAARVGASFTAVLASMKINEEILALETMAVNPAGYLVAPRFLSMFVMLPCLTLFADVIGMVGGALVAHTSYDISTNLYLMKTTFYLNMRYVVSGLIKATVFSVIISTVCCYNGLITKGGPMGLGRSTMVAVVTSLVLIVVADALLTGIIVKYILV